MQKNEFYFKDYINYIFRMPPKKSKNFSRSKKRKKRKETKKKNLSIMNPEFILSNQCWIPKKCKKKFKYKTNSWFDIISTDKRNTPTNPRTRATGETTEMRCEQIQIYPTAVQKVKLLSWMETYRQLYNLTISNRSKFINKGFMMSYHKIRTLIQNDYLPQKINLLNQIHLTDDLTEIQLTKKKQKKYKVPAHSIWNAVNDVTKAFKTAKANKDAGNIKSFRLRHKKQSSPTRTFVIEPISFSGSKNGFCITELGEMKSSKPFGEVKHDCRLSYSYLTDRFILHKPYTKITKIDHFKSDVIALDPGMRTFQNGYSPNGICYKFGTKKTNVKLKKLLNRINNVVKGERNENGSLKKHKKFTKRLRKSVTDMVTDLHWKTSNFLCKNFDTILVGNMSTTGIVKKEKSVLTASDKVYCIALSHYKFRERLISKAAEHAVTCHIVDESYTTQTCGKCGQRNLNVGSSKVFRCPQKTCKFKFDRDYNAGRNIYLKALSNRIV